MGEREIVKWQGARVYADEVSMLDRDWDLGGNVFLTSPDEHGVRSRINPDSVEAGLVVSWAALDEMVNATEEEPNG